MPSSDAFAFSRSRLNEFLFAPVGTEANGMTLSVVSVFARLGKDPWLEADRLAKLPKSEATESLARIIAGMPTSLWPLQAATAIAVRLVALLPTLSGKPGESLSASGLRARAGRFLGFTALLVCFACVLAYQTGLTASDLPNADASSVAGFAASPPR